jgi:hypothetical protein
MADMTVPDDMVALFHQMRTLLEEILAADTHIAASSFGVIYLTADQLDRIRTALLAAEGFSALKASMTARSTLT